MTMKCQTWKILFLNLNIKPQILGHIDFPQNLTNSLTESENRKVQQNL